jgi:hypothetical protein
MNLWVPLNAGNFLTSWGTVSFSGRPLPHGGALVSNTFNLTWHENVLAGNQPLSACNPHYITCTKFLPNPCTSWVLLSELASFVRVPPDSHCSCHCTHITEERPLADFLFDLPRDFLASCQIVCTCWMTLSTNTICPAFPSICATAHSLPPTVSLTNMQLSSSTAYVCH